MKHVVKAMLSVILTIAMVFGMMPGMSLTAYADTVDSGNCGENVSWTLDDEEAFDDIMYNEKLSPEEKYELLK